MDDWTRYFYEVQFREAYRERTADEFQDLFSSIMEKRYPGDFMRVCPWGNLGDKKNDGYLRSRRTIFQCYAPNEMDAAKCVAKIDKDFNGALQHWREYFATWAFVHNSGKGLGAPQTGKLLELGKLHAPLIVASWGFEELRQEAMGLAEPELASLFGASPSRHGMADLGLEDLVPVLDQIVRLAPTHDPDLRPVPADKLERNMLSADVASLLKAGMSRSDLVRRYFKYKPMLQDQIAESFRSRFAALSASKKSPDEVFEGLQRFAGGNAIRSAGAQNAVFAVLAFFFEECDIFERPEPPGGG
jgi:hypothetical protein